MVTIKECREGFENKLLQSMKSSLVKNFCIAILSSIIGYTVAIKTFSEQVNIQCPSSTDTSSTDTSSTLSSIETIPTENTIMSIDPVSSDDILDSNTKFVLLMCQ